MKKLQTLVMAAIFSLLFGCFGGGDDEELPALADISGTWKGFGWLTATKGPEKAKGVAMMIVVVQPLGEGEYLATYEIRSYQVAWVERGQEKWLYQDDMIHFPNGSAVRIRKKKINIIREWRSNELRLKAEIELRLLNS